MRNDDNLNTINEINNFKKEDLTNFIDFASTASAYGYITQNTQQYVRDLEVAKLLGKKFSLSGMFDTAQNSKDWLNTRLEVNPNNLDQIFRRLQGDGAGEVDVINKINGSLKGLIYKAEYATNNSGNIVNNVPGIDAIVKNRFTGEIVEKIQIKSNWSTDPNVLKQTVEDFLKNKSYNEHIVLCGPKELIKIAKEMNIKNPTMIYGTVDQNRDSAERLMKITQQGNLESSLTFGGISEKVGEGALIGAGIRIGISALTSYLEYQNGKITKYEAFDKIAIDGSKGALIGGSLAGMALIFPPGLIGIGIGVIVGRGIRKIIDLAYGNGEYERILGNMYKTNNLSTGLIHFALTTSEIVQMQKPYVDSLIYFEQSSKKINQISTITNDLLDKSIDEKI